MFSLPGPCVHTCQGISRRDLLRVGGLGLFGLSLPALLRGQAQAASSEKSRTANFGKAKSCLIVFLNGGASHHDTFDMKPDAPAEIRGEFKPIASNVPGIRVCEHLPHLARQADKYRVVRSLSHQDTNHPSGVYWMVTGHPYHKGIGSGLSENISREDHPHIGSQLTAVEGKRQGRAAVRHAARITSPSTGPSAPGSTAASSAAATIRSCRTAILTAPNSSRCDLGLVPAVGPERLHDRRALLASINRPARATWSKPRPAGALDDYYEKAFGVLASGVTQRAFDIARRAGEGARALRPQHVRPVGPAGPAAGRGGRAAGPRQLDPHPGTGLGHAQRQLQRAEEQAAAADRSGHSRRCLDDMNGQRPAEGDAGDCHGRIRPQSQDHGRQRGREHWPHVFTILMAGAGIPGGRLYGASDKQRRLPAGPPHFAGRAGGHDLPRPGGRSHEPGDDDAGTPLADLRGQARAGPVGVTFPGYPSGMQIVLF